MKKIAAKDYKRLDTLFKDLKHNSRQILGYPVSMDFDYSELYDFLDIPINNIGDPFEFGDYTNKTHAVEREVITFFAKLFRANPRDYWGYITNGGSESNLYGLYLARESFPNAMVYFSESTHYSVRKNIHLLNIPSIVIRAQENGEMDYEDFEQAISMHRHKSAIVLANYGTTMTEARDDVSKIKKILRKLAIHNHYIHCDGALAGAYGAFVEPKVPFDFKDGVDSIAVSGHKFIGSPMPCGIVVTKRSHKDRISKAVSYISTYDTTITGSRNGLSPLFMWYGLKKLGLEGLKQRYQHCLTLVEYCKTALQDIGITAWSNPGAITLVIPRVAESIRKKWQLASEENISHIICMPSVTTAQIDALVEDLQQVAEAESEAFELVF